METISSIKDVYRLKLINPLDLLKSVKNRNQNPVELKDYQINHFKILFWMLFDSYFAVDGSDMGSGKTWVAIALAQALNLPICIICPKGVIPNWENALNRTKAPRWETMNSKEPFIFTYNLLSTNTKTSEPRHGLFTVSKIKTSKGDTTEYKETELLKQLISHGTLFIVDECQKAKNPRTITSKIIRFLTATVKNHVFNDNTIGKIYNPSKILFTTGTLADKDEHLENFMHLFGFIDSNNLIRNIDGQVVFTGIDELFDVGRRLNKVEHELYISDKPTSEINKNTVKAYAAEYWIKVIKPKTMSIMPRDESLFKNARRVVMDALYPLSIENTIKYQDAINGLANSLGFSKEKGEVTEKKFTGMSKFLKKIQEAKADLLIQLSIINLSRKWYSSKNNMEIFPKIIIYASFHSIINYLYEQLKEYNPLVYTGHIRDNRVREHIRLAFQQPSNNHRVIICNPKAAGIGISLHNEFGFDNVGIFPRFMFYLPDYDVMTLNQAFKRDYRNGTIGLAVNIVVYGNVEGIRENSICNAIARKGSMLNKMKFSLVNIQLILTMKFYQLMNQNYAVKKIMILLLLILHYSIFYQNILKHILMLMKVVMKFLLKQ